MKKYVCPHCGEATISPLKKAFAGNQKSKGVECPNCGKRCTNGMASTVFHTVTSFIGLVAIIFLYIKLENSFYCIVAIMAGVALINKIFDALFFPLVPSLRINL